MKNIIKKGVINNYNNGKLLIIRLKIEKFFLKLKKLLFIFSNRMTEITKRKITNKKLLLKQIKYNIQITRITITQPVRFSLMNSMGICIISRSSISGV